MIDHDTVRKIAALARLRLSPDEVARLASELSAITAYVAQLGALDTDGVPETVQAVCEPLRLRDDEPRPSLPRAAALDNAPDAVDGFFRVPAAVDDAAPK